MTSKEMLKTECKPGYWFINIAPLGKIPNWKITPLPTPEQIDAAMHRDKLNDGYFQRQIANAIRLEKL